MSEKIDSSPEASSPSTNPPAHAPPTVLAGFARPGQPPEIQPGWVSILQATETSPSAIVSVVDNGTSYTETWYMCTGVGSYPAFHWLSTSDTGGYQYKYFAISQSTFNTILAAFGTSYVKRTHTVT